MADTPSPLRRRPPLIIGVAGGTGSGKTTVAKAILERVGWNRIAFIQHDSYYHDAANLPLDARARLNFDHPDALDTPLLVKHLQMLRAGRAVDIPIYDYRTHTRSPETRRVTPEPVILVEGILIFAEPALRALFDVKIYVDTDPDIRFIRRLTRDMKERGRSLESVIEQYLTTVRPMHMEFVEPTKRYADVIIPEGGLNTVALDLVVSRIQALLRNAGAEAEEEGEQP
ncbi:MAG: uridine kinase [Caldilineales bacterium]|nr:uridine kinase [Caldilineales bacterium]MDW8318570.1 uridine kinase [Anaerolineae bacterium]